eukprot:TRINITY_DN21465_c0_g1_i1.p1 TRINITY_DN21465_c0_g1~~TRINITY_DN21465_c0_g1_i1.p1  ORF type:complete len:337 (+),score=123.13 TRINITY_DN21465_c0_g1_i1:28-1011(+)
MPKALQSVRPGPPSTLELRDVAPLKPGRGEVVISVRTVSVSFHDTLIIQDKYQITPKRPFSPGGECAGIITAVGPGVDPKRVGERVRAGGIYGMYAEEVVAHSSMVWPLQPTVPFERAFLGNYSIAMYALVNRGGLRRGEKVLVLGAAGGLGICAVELAKHLGATVIAAASTDEKLKTCKEYGADHVINYESTSLRQAVKAVVPGGVDVVFDPVGGRWSEPALKCLRWGGRHLVLGFAGNAVPKLPLNLLLLNGVDVRGVLYMPQKEPQLLAVKQKVDDMYTRGQIRPLVTRVYRLEDGAEALADVAGRRAQGKIVLTTAAHRASKL